jgi:hypothetical protein
MTKPVKEEIRISNEAQIKNKVELRTNDREGRTLLKTTVREDVEERTIKRTITWEPRDLQIKWDKLTGEIVHLDCKSCHNSWGMKKDGSLELNKKFDVKEKVSILRCKKCNREWRTGGGYIEWIGEKSYCVDSDTTAGWPSSLH